ncbi:hypothetical protein C8Q80DRAFT_1273270 [Daedaleopsis nitida]|nr:hypothetical protein C8Q80DRAFT_1273270 [Daedaleopsis nitida]
MASAIISWVAKQAGSYIFDAVKKELFGDAADKMDILIKEQEEIKHTIETLELEGRIYEASQHIMDWTVQLKEKLVIADRGNREELDRFVNDIGNANTGVHYALSNLYNGLLGNTGTGGGRKLLDVWHDNAYRHLQDTNDLNYTILSYVEEMDTKLEAVFELVRNGLILLIMTTKDQQQANDWSTEWEKKMRGLMQTVYDNYPAAVKLLKPSYEASWMADAWWRLQRSSTRNKWLYHRSNGSVDFGVESGSSTEWKFNPSVTSGLVGLVTRDGDRLKIDSYFAGGMSGHLEELKRGVNVVFKMVPLTGSEPIISMDGPYKESDRSKIDCRLNKNAGVVVPFSDWVLHAA